jgi:NTP pyrophosphatase (non-canonical NTP hydrolase)
VDLAVKLAVLGEEVGEVSRAFLEKDAAGLRAELVQVAAVCIAILEGIDS